VRSLVQQGLRVTAITLASFAFASPAFAQLRTGRESDREFYSTQPTPMPTSSAPRGNAKGSPASPRAAKVAKAVKGDIVQASTLEGTGTSQSSRVEHAGCKNCQAGIAHSHAPMSTSSRRHIEMESDDSSAMVEPDNIFYESDPIYESDASSARSIRQTCASDCDSNGFIQPHGLLSQLLRRSQLRFEAVTFWPEGRNLPQLVTTRRPANDPATDGLIGRPDTINLFGGGESLGKTSQGVRGEYGLFFDLCRTNGIMLRFFDAGSNSESYSSTPTSEPVVMRPFFSTNSNAQSTIAVNYPGSTSGSLDAKISTELYGGDILYRKLILQDCAGRVEFLAGYQTARLADQLMISSTTTALTNTPAPAGTVSQLTDHFATTNRFNGMALGLNGIMRERAWSLSGMFKLGMGNMERSVSIDGASTITVPGNPPSTNATANGLLARGTNDGNYVMNTFVVTPEVNVTLGYRLTRRLEATVGYSYLGLPKVARVADQLDPQLAANLSNPLTGPIRPGFTLTESNFALHSLNYGLQWKY
ncbi:MAG: BBP7 family outer membrane beta-barrel protein, partial [Pirellula sp.]